MNILNTRPLVCDEWFFASGQADFQLNLLDAQVELLEKFSLETFPHLPLILKVCYVANLSFTSRFSSGLVKFDVTRPDGQVEVNS